MKLWIDDLRTPPEGWDWAKTSAEAVGMIALSHSMNPVGRDWLNGVIAHVNEKTVTHWAAFQCSRTLSTALKRGDERIPLLRTISSSVRMKAGESKSASNVSLFVSYVIR